MGSTPVRVNAERVVNRSLTARRVAAVSGPVLEGCRRSSIDAYDKAVNRARTPVQLILLMCAAEVLSMVGAVTFPALLPTFIDVWELSTTDAGWINGIYFAGYLVVVPVLVSLTDRLPPRRIYLSVSC